MDAHLRVHTQFITQSNVIEFLDRYCTSYYLVREVDATRPHYQAMCRFKVEYQNLESLRNQLKKRLSEKGNKVYSISAQRESQMRHLAYLMKEGGEPVAKLGISVTLMTGAKELQADYEKKKKMTTVERLAYEYQGSTSVSDICKYVMEETKRSGKMLPDPRLMKRYIQNIQVLKWPEMFQRQYIDEVQNLFSQY